jgi:predicted O-methyltransferase YrrM
LSASSDLAEHAERARRATSDVDGWLSESQGRALFAAAARATGRGRIVEIGSWKGRSTIWLAHGARLSGQRVFAVDPHVGSHEDPDARTFETFRSNIQRAGVADVVTPLVMTSAKAAGELRGGIEVLFIDGDHSDDGSRADADLWLPRLIEGGTVLMHDVATDGYTGPRRVFRRDVCWSANFGGVRRVGSMGIATRVSHRGPADVVWGGTAGVLLYLLDVKRMVRKVRST